MCGISGIINLKLKDVDKKDINEINDLISHRGPDSEGFYFEKNFAFGHRRLSILDLSKDGHQPMHYKNRYTITYNGEIYNYLEIKSQLIELGYSFDSQTDTEVILASYDKWGEKCVDNFNGMWSFAIYDAIEEIIFCSRDRFGIKPFYYTEIDDKFIFGSEIKQLIHFQKERFVNKKLLIDYLVNNMEEHTNKTFFEGINKLEQSHNLTFNLKTSNYKIKRYYELTQKNETSNQEYQSELEKAIKLRLRSDVKVGTCLSGGLDSSTVAAIASKLNTSNEKFNAIHAKSQDKICDESNYAKTAAEHSNINLTIIEPNSETFIKSINDVIETQEEPFGGPSIFMQYFVMQEAKKNGLKVMLDGQGGDETLLGYNRHYPSVLYSTATKEGLIKGYKAFRASSKQNTNLGFKNSLKYTLGTFLPVARLKLNIRAANFVKKEHLKYNDFSYLKEFAKASKHVFEMQKIELMKTSLPVLLKYEDKNSMRNSIEARVPFIDYKVVEHALNLPNQSKIKDGWSKFVLRDLAKNYLPKNIVWRKNKFGFESPDKSWLSSYEKEMYKAVEMSIILNFVCKERFHEKYMTLPLRKQWQLYNIAKWEEIFNVKIK